MFGGDGTYKVTSFDAGNDSNKGNSAALTKLIELGYVYNDTRITTNKFTNEILENLMDDTFTRIVLPYISLQKNHEPDKKTYQPKKIEVNEVNNGKAGALIGQVIFT